MNPTEDMAAIFNVVSYILKIYIPIKVSIQLYNNA